eukprot:CAMPEP_0179841060 /NCGR_PEP_ID=MMETSP0982-20121206/2294_1 /TAXON_ID=483367 /ORGANISM="non described non described, Strain CCMP 2436" /LENGTH=82 /DNA_ID=CAMNT_0021725045 /DNA_START=116 /DNA_END=360 /DNA_ORIENTATION=-
MRTLNRVASSTDIVASGRRRIPSGGIRARDACDAPASANAQAGRGALSRRSSTCLRFALLRFSIDMSLVRSACWYSSPRAET